MNSSDESLFLSLCYNREMISDRSILEAAIEGFELQRKRLDETIVNLRAQLDGAATGTKPVSAPAPKKRRLSAAGRKAIAEAARKRWAAVKAAKATPKKAAAKKDSTPKRKMSAAAKAKLIANLKKARAAKAAKKSAGQAVPF